MNRSVKRIVIVFLSIFALFTAAYFWYIAPMTENHTIRTHDYQIELSIKMDETFLDGQDDYRFSFSLKNKPNNQVELKIDDCLSRCWILSKSSKTKKKVLLHGCDWNSRLFYLINLETYSYKKLKEMPEDYILIDTLTNLYPV